MTSALHIESGTSPPRRVKKLKRVIECIGHEDHKCGKKVHATVWSQRRCSTCTINHRREYLHKYARSAKRRKVNREYQLKRYHSAKGREYTQKHTRTAEYREYHLKYSRRPKWRKYRQEYNRSLKMRKWRRKYGREHKRRIETRHERMLVRSKKLRKRGVISRPLSLKRYKEKVLYPDGRTRMCSYCRHDVSEGGSGLDRMDNKVGYTDANTVVCCGGCNAWKNSHHTFEETMNHFKPMRDAALRAYRQSQLVAA